ncbi:MAG: glycosyltransferase, partial [Proteobacteria bacterium]|nr:glycosyltransferase [Pseudomonadota bacterium]
LNKYIDTIFVPSHFCREVLTNSGVKKKIIVAPFGVNRSVFTPRNVISSSLFQFLFVGTPHYRKGVLELIEAFKNVFENKTDVTLHMKFTYKPDLQHLKPWEIGNIESLIKGTDNITIDYSIMNDNDIADLIASSDVVVQPSYSEGFGLSILEAMVMKKPVITTCWSGECEFVNRHNALVIDSVPIRTDSIQYGEKARGAQMQKPSVKKLSELLEYAYNNFSELTALKDNAYSTASTFTWQKTAETILKSIY